MTNNFELNDLPDFYQDYLGAEDWTYNGSQTVKIIFSAKDFMAFVQAVDLGFSPDMFDELEDTNAKKWYVTQFEEIRYEEYRIQTTDVAPLIADIQSPSPVIGDSGGYTMGYATASTQSIFLDPISGDNKLFDQKLQNLTQFKLMMKYDATIDQNFRFKIGTRILEIKHILNTNSFFKQLEMIVIESL